MAWQISHAFMCPPISIHHFRQQIVSLLGPNAKLYIMSSATHYARQHSSFTPVQRPNIHFVVSALILTPFVPSKCGLESTTTRASSCHARNQRRMKIMNPPPQLPLMIPMVRLVLIVIRAYNPAPSLILNLNRNRCLSLNVYLSRVLTSVDAENERLCYQHMLLITRAPDPEDDCELSPKSDQTISPGVDAGATTKPPATKMNGGTEMETKRKIESTASPAIIVKPDEKTIMGIPAGTTLCLTET